MNQPNTSGAKRRKIQPENNKKITDEEPTRILEESDLLTGKVQITKALTILAMMIHLPKMKVMNITAHYIWYR